MHRRRLMLWAIPASPWVASIVYAVIVHPWSR